MNDDNTMPAPETEPAAEPTPEETSTEQAA